MQSLPIEIDGRLVGGAVRSEHGYRFIAVDVRLEPIDKWNWSELPELERAVRHFFRTGQLPAE